MSGYALFVNEARTVLVRVWPTGTAEVATRESPEHSWGPPVYCRPETKGFLYPVLASARPGGER